MCAKPFHHEKNGHAVKNKTWLSETKVNACFKYETEETWKSLETKFSFRVNVKAIIMKKKLLLAYFEEKKSRIIIDFPSLNENFNKKIN